MLTNFSMHLELLSGVQVQGRSCVHGMLTNHGEEHIKHADRRVEVNHYLRVLLMEREEGLLRVNLQKFIFLDTN